MSKQGFATVVLAVGLPLLGGCFPTTYPPRGLVPLASTAEVPTEMVAQGVAGSHVGHVVSMHRVARSSVNGMDVRGLGSTTVPSVQQLQFGQQIGNRTSPGWARWSGGFIAGTATMVGMIAATWNDPDAIPGPLVYAGYVAGTALGTTATTAIWEKPNRGILIGATLGAVPLLVALTSDDDDEASMGLLAAWIAAPLGAAIGQAQRRR